MITPRLQILEASLAKKKAAFDASLSAHISDVKRANGQPLNDKRNGHVTLNRWDRQDQALRAKKEGIEKTERAIEIERGKIVETTCALDRMPQPILDLVESGVLAQWRKHPHTFFVAGVDKARISFKDGQLTHKYSSSITDKAQWAIFRDTFNGLKAAVAATVEVSA